MNLIRGDHRKLGKQALSLAIAIGIWFAPIPAGLTAEAWHLFAVFAAAIFSVIVNAFPLPHGLAARRGRGRADRNC
jgi:di/tricarboxylate transporter